MLSTSRGSNGFGPTHLTISDMISLLAIKRPIVGDLLALEIWQAMDQAFLEDWLAKKDSEAEK